LGGNLSFTDALAGVSNAEKELLSLNRNTDIDSIGDERPLTEQPDSIMNFDVTFSNPEWGTSVTLAFNKKSEILQSIGSEASFDVFRGEEERLDLIISHQFEIGLVLSFAVKNLLDEGYETYYRNRATDFSNTDSDNSRDPDSYGSDIPRTTVESVGRSFSISASYEF
jgi:outer membrane receptor protein involved in Fe transport